MRALIPTMVDDAHTHVVARALDMRGHAAQLWYGADLPQQQHLTWGIDARGGATFELRSDDGLTISDEIDVVWLRRPTLPVLPADMHPGDHEFARREWTRCDAGMWRTIAPAAFWVNPYEAAERAKSKALQLREAQALGLAIPQTLISNDPARIRAFIRSQPGETIYKPFLPAQWHDPETGSTHQLMTTVVAESDLPDDELLRLTPGIFQPRLAKSHELRVTCIGHHLFVAHLDSQAHDATQVDWRPGSWLIDTRVGSLPDAVARRCRALLDRLGLVFGCIDFIVTPAGEHVFLEVNQMGQFLWLEQREPRLALLDAFCELLIQRRPDFEWDPERVQIRYADVADAADAAATDAKHVDAPISHRMTDAWHPLAQTG